MWFDSILSVRFQILNQLRAGCFVLDQDYARVVFVNMFDNFALQFRIPLGPDSHIRLRSG
jgi:hypothetical protein